MSSKRGLYFIRPRIKRQLMLLLFHPLTVIPVLFAFLKPQLVYLRVCLYCARKGRESRGCNMLETHAKRIGREESTQHTYNPYLGLWQSLPRKQQNRKHFCHKVHAHSCGARLTGKTLAKEPRRACFLLTQECPGGTDWRAKPSSMGARLLTAIFQDQPESLASTQETWVIFLVQHNESEAEGWVPGTHSETNVATWLHWLLN